MLTDPHKMLSRLGVYSGNARNYMLSSGQLYPPKYTGTAKSLEVGDKLSVLQSIAKWRGFSALDGERQKIVKTLWACKTNVMKYVDDQLPAGELRALAKDMVDSLADFH